MKQCVLLAWFLFMPWGPLRAEPVEIVLWHSMAGSLGSEVRQLADGFNQTQADYLIKPVYKGNYLESLTSFASAFRAGRTPELIQVFEVGTATLRTPPGVIKPVDELMRDNQFTIPEASFFPTLLKTYGDERGRLQAMPFNASIPVVFYNADALAKLGYTADNFPATWEEFETLAATLRSAGFSCAYTSAYPGWVLVESYAAIHALPMLDESQQWALYNHPSIITHLERLARWQRLHYFEYGGQGDDATALFLSRRCPLFSQSSGAYRSLSALAPFQVGVALLPLDEQFRKQRASNVVGGAAVWAVAGKSPAVYRGIALFFDYLLNPSTQHRWHENTGYLPLGANGIYRKITQASTHPVLALAQKDLTHGDESHVNVVPNSIRRLNDEALEAIFSGLKTPRQAINDAVARANRLLLRFKKNTQGKAE